MKTKEMLKEINEEFRVLRALNTSQAKIIERQYKLIVEIFDLSLMAVKGSVLEQVKRKCATHLSKKGKGTR